MRVNIQTFCQVPALCLALSTPGLAAGVDDFVARTCEDGKGHTLPYRLFIPSGYDESKRYPLKLYLHGAGARGTDNLKQMSDVAKYVREIDANEMPPWYVAMDHPGSAQLGLGKKRVLEREQDWNPSRTATLNGKPIEDLTINGRPYEVFEHGVKPEWGYRMPQQDAFILIHPKNERKNAPLYVVLHSAGHDFLSCVKCTREVGNHDIYRSPDDFYALYLDCRRNQGDWWWGGMHLNDAALIKKNSGGESAPVERRVMDTVKWVIEQYDINPNRVYLCGISMGGSGTFGIGMRNGDVFAAIKADVPAGIEHVAQRMYFPPQVAPEGVTFPDPPIAIDYSAQNDDWSIGHERFVKAMDERKYALYFYWGPFGHAHNNAAIEKVNDLVNSFDWLNVRKNEAYPVFANATSNNKPLWPDDLKSNSAGQVNAFFRWECLSDTKNKLEMSLFLVTPAQLKTTFDIPTETTADVSLRRIQNGQLKPGGTFQWTFGSARGEGKADAGGVITIPGLRITAEPTALIVSKSSGN